MLDRRQSRRIPIMFLLVATVTSVSAQPAQPKPPVRTRPEGRDERDVDAVDAERAAHESEDETIAKCLTDLESDDVAARRRAVLVLGKYAASRAQQAVITCLEDPDAFVRRSALVALSEQRGIPVQARKPIVSLLRDPSVHIRRIASSLLPEILMTSRFGGTVFPPGARTAADPTLEAELRELLNAALADDDLVVRKNVLALYRYTADLFSEEAIIGCLDDTDKEVRVNALRVLAGKIPRRPELFERLTPLADDPEPVVREETARTLGRLGPRALPMLRQLAKDPVPSVRAEAVQRLAQLRDLDAFADIQSLLTDGQVSVADRRSLIRHLLPYGAAAVPLLREHAKRGPTPLRAEAVRALGALGANSPDLTFFLGLVTDPSEDVRKAAMAALRRNARKLDRNRLTALATSRHTDVRRTAMDMVLQLPGAEASEMIIEFLLDEDIDLRCAAVKAACVKGIPEWPLFLAQSLEDPEPQIQRVAIDALLKRKDAQSRRILADYVKYAVRSASAETRLSALRAYARMKPPSPAPQMALEPLLRDPEEAIRIELVEMVGRLGKNGVDMLRQLAADPSLQVKSRAVARLALLEDPTAFRQLSALILDQALEQDQRTELIRYLAPCGEQAVPLLLKLVKSPSTQTRAAAVLALGLSPSRPMVPNFFVQLLSDPSPEVQDAAAMAIRRQAPRLTPAEIRILFNSGRSDLRSTALLQAYRMPVKDASDMVRSAFDDPDPGLRAAAVRVACTRSLPTWHLLARKALKDDNSQVRRITASALLARRDVASRQLLTQFIGNTEDSQLAEFVQQQLARQQSKVAKPKRVVRPGTRPR